VLARFGLSTVADTHTRLLEESRRCTTIECRVGGTARALPCERCRGSARRKGGSMSTEGNDPTAARTPARIPRRSQRRSRIRPRIPPPESLAAPEPPPAAPDPEPEPDPAPTPPPPTPPPAAESTAAVPHRRRLLRARLRGVPRSVWVSVRRCARAARERLFSWYTVSVHAGPLSISKSGSGWDTTMSPKLVALLALVALAVWAVELFRGTASTCPGRPGWSQAPVSAGNSPCALPDRLEAWRARWLATDRRSPSAPPGQSTCR